MPTRNCPRIIAGSRGGVYHVKVVDGVEKKIYVKRNGRYVKCWAAKRARRQARRK